MLWAGFRTDKIYFVRQDREIGKSRWTLAKKVKLVMDSVMSFSYFPLRFMTGLGVLFNLLAIVLLISEMVEKITKGTPIVGWASLMCVILCASGVIMLMLGILGEYIWRTLDAARTRPPYIVDEVLEERDKDGEK